MRFAFYIVMVLVFLSCGVSNVMEQKISATKNQQVFQFDTNYIATQFRNPVGNPPGVGYYDAQPFMKNTHLGEDWNGKGGGNTDLGDTIYACASGYIMFAEDIRGGWGNVIRILHRLPAGKQYKEVESVYAHCDTIFVQKHNYIKMGTPIGTIGTAHDIYPAHLHFELRHNVTMEIGGGYSEDTSGYLNPKKFIAGFK